MKTAAALITAIIVPGGFVVLGIAIATMIMSRRRDTNQRLTFSRS